MFKTKFFLLLIKLDSAKLPSGYNTACTSIEQDVADSNSITENYINNKLKDKNEYFNAQSNSELDNIIDQLDIHFPDNKINVINLNFDVTPNPSFKDILDDIYRKFPIDESEITNANSNSEIMNIFNEPEDESTKLSSEKEAISDEILFKNQIEDLDDNIEDLIYNDKLFSEFENSENIKINRALECPERIEQKLNSIKNKNKLLSSDATANTHKMKLRQKPKKNYKN